MRTERKTPSRRVDPRRQPERRGRTTPAPSRETKAARSGPQAKTMSRASVRTASPKGTRQAKARAKARKAKTPRVVRAPLRERLIVRLASVDLRPRTLAAKVPFVVLIIGSLGVGLGITLWLSTDAAERSYQLGSIREQNRALLQQREALERDVRNAESAPALAEAARQLGMIPTKDTAHLVKDPAGNWVVVGSPKPAEGAPPAPLNTKLPDEQPVGPPAARPAEVPVRVAPGAAGTGPEVSRRAPRGGTPPGAQRPPVTGPATDSGVPALGTVADPPPASAAGLPPVFTPGLPLESLPPQGLPSIPAVALPPMAAPPTEPEPAVPPAPPGAAGPVVEQPGPPAAPADPGPVG